MKKILLTFLIATCLISCTDDEVTPFDPGDISNGGYLIVNEGNFQSANGSISFLSNDLSTTKDNIFKSVNGRTIGDVAQSLATTDKYVFIVVNNSNTIEVVDRKTFKSVKTISTNLYSPRYIVAKNNKIYVSNMNKAEISIFNAETFDFIKSIALDFTGENIVASNNYIYVANNFYSGGTLVEIIDPSTDTNTNDISFSNPINGLTTDTNNVYVLDTNDATSNITKVTGTTKETSLALPQANARYLVYDQNHIYFTAATGVYKTNVNLNTPSKLFDVPNNDFSTLYGFNVFNGSIFTSDANGFKDNGTITIYKEDGTTIKSFKAGIGPSGFYKF